MSGRVIVSGPLLAAVLAGCAGCGGGGGAGGVPAPSVPTTVRITSSAFSNGAAIPDQFTCRGAGQPPPLTWSAPPGAVAQALVVDDPDAPGGRYLHWVVIDLPGSTAALPAGGALPAGAKQARNSAGRTGWTPPCPPSGTHHYRFTLYPLRSPTGLADGVPARDALEAIGRLATGSGQLTGLVTHR